MKTQISQLTLVSVFLACLAVPANALPTLGRRIEGTIQKVDSRVPEAEMQRDDTKSILTFGWNKRTQFLANDQKTDAAILRSGTRVKVLYHTPFFGKPFVSRVKLSNPASLEITAGKRQGVERFSK